MCIKSPLIIIASKRLLQDQMKNLDFDFEINDINKELKDFSKLNNNKINLINVDYDFKKCFEKITSKSNKYIDETFKTALNFIKQNNLSKFINGPVSKKSFLKGKILGLTEYLAKKTKSNEVAMLIFNKNLSVSPLTTHLALKDVHKKITKQKNLYNRSISLIVFIKRKFNKLPRIAITGLNPHCESNFQNSEEDKIIIPAIKKLKLKNAKINGPFSC